MEKFYYTVTSKDEPDGNTKESRSFAKFDNAYAFQNKEARKWLKGHPERIKECSEDKALDGGPFRTVYIYDKNTGEVNAHIKLERNRFSDDIVETYAHNNGIRKSDFPKKKAS